MVHRSTHHPPTPSSIEEGNHFQGSGQGRFANRPYTPRSPRARKRRATLLHNQINARFADDRRLGSSGYSVARG